MKEGVRDVGGCSFFFLVIGDWKCERRKEGRRLTRVRVEVDETVRIVDVSVMGDNETEEGKEDAAADVSAAAKIDG